MGRTWDEWLLSRMGTVPGETKRAPSSTTALAFFVFMLAGYLVAKFFSDIIENTEWRRKLRSDAEARIAKDEADHRRKTAGQSPAAKDKKSK